MPEPIEDIRRLWVLKEIIKATNNKCKILCEKDDILSKQSISALMSIVSEATEKIQHMRWTDDYGLQHGIDIYLQAIENL